MGNGGHLLYIKININRLAMAAVSGQMMMGELEYEHRKKNEEMFVGVRVVVLVEEEEEFFFSVVGPRRPAERIVGFPSSIPYLHCSMPRPFPIPNSNPSKCICKQSSKAQTKILPCCPFVVLS
jgi:hypothetical protein